MKQILANALAYLADKDPKPKPEPEPEPAPIPVPDDWPPKC